MGFEAVQAAPAPAKRTLPPLRVAKPTFGWTSSTAATERWDRRGLHRRPDVRLCMSGRPHQGYAGDPEMAVKVRVDQAWRPSILTGHGSKEAPSGGGSSNLPPSRVLEPL
jgi:hypothetical protein